MDSPEFEERAVSSLVEHGLAPDRTTSRRIVKEVMRSVLDESEIPVHMSTVDIEVLDELADEVSHLVWEVEEMPGDHSNQLVAIIRKSRHIIKIARRYVSPDAVEEKAPREPSPELRRRVY